MDVITVNLSLRRVPYDDALVHATLGIRARPNVLHGRADSQDRMDQDGSISELG